MIGTDYRVVNWDAPGYGESPVVEPTTIETFADAAQEMIRHEATETNVVLGHSMGALIGPRLTNMEDKVGGLILSAGYVGIPNRSPENRALFLEERLAPLERGMTAQEYARPLITHMMAKGASGPLVDYVFDVVLSMKTETFRASLNALTLYNGRQALVALSKPTFDDCRRVRPRLSRRGHAQNARGRGRQRIPGDRGYRPLWVCLKARSVQGRCHGMAVKALSGRMKLWRDQMCSGPAAQPSGPS